MLPQYPLINIIYQLEANNKPRGCVHYQWSYQFVSTRRFTPYGKHYTVQMSNCGLKALRFIARLSEDARTRIQSGGIKLMCNRQAGKLRIHEQRIILMDNLPLTYDAIITIVKFLLNNFKMQFHVPATEKRYSCS